MGCVPSKKCVEPNVIKQVVEKPTTVASILEAVPFLLKNIPTDVLRTNLLPYLSNSYEPDALPDQNVPNIICKYYSDGEDMIYTLVRYGSIENWNTSKITDDRLTFCIGRLKYPYGLCSYEKDYAITHDSIIAGLRVWPASKVTYVPEFVALYEIIPYIEYLPLDNETIRVAVKDYLKRGKKQDDIIKKYGPIVDWNTSEVNDNTIPKKLRPESHVCKRYRWNTQMKKFDGKKPFRPKTRSHKGNKMRY